MTSFELFISQVLLGVMPNAVIWGVILLIVFGLYMAWNRLPASIVSMCTYMLVLIISKMLGGLFVFGEVIMIALLATVFVLGFLKLAAR